MKHIHFLCIFLLLTACDGENDLMNHQWINDNEEDTCQLKPIIGKKVFNRVLVNGYDGHYYDLWMTPNYMSSNFSLSSSSCEYPELETYEMAIVSGKVKYLTQNDDAYFLSYWQNSRGAGNTVAYNVYLTEEFSVCLRGNYHSVVTDAVCDSFSKEGLGY